MVDVPQAILKPVEAITAHVEYLASENERLHTLLSTLYVNARRSVSNDPLVQFMRDHLGDVQHGKKTLNEAIKQVSTPIERGEG